MDKLWYYTVGKKEQRGPITEDDLRAKIQSGEVPLNELVWTDGMTGWVPVGNEPTFKSGTDSSAPLPPPTLPLAAPVPTPRVAVPAFGGWLTFVGLFNILSGSMMILTCFGTPAGILMILAGIAAMGAKTALDQTGDIPAEFAPVMARLRKFFIYTGVIVILNLVAFVLFALTMSSSLAIALPQILEQLQ